MQNHVLDYLTAIVDKNPDHTAFSDGTEGLTFREIYDQSRAVGTFLHCRGVYKKPVAVFMNKHPREVAAFFGVITGGDFYIPLDEEMPKSRIQLILENAKPELIICDAETEPVANAFDFTGDIALYDDICRTEADDGALKAIYDRTIDTDPLYIIFTSGSTGIPKGVVACHRSVIDYIEQLSDVLEFSSDTVFGNQSPLYFDACLKELYPTLKFGATTYLIPKQLFMFPVKLVEFLNEHRINTVCWVVSALTMISAFDTFKTVTPEYLTTVAFGSEVFPINQFRRWQAALPDAKFINLYGPTECTGMSCYYKVDREFEPGDAIPIGRPFKNTEIILLDEQNRRINPGTGETGEICIRGTSLCHGYYNDASRTAEAFVQNPLNSAYPEMLYRTNDLGRYNEWGELVFVSRKDYQIKHMGHRIELGEIEANVNALDGVRIAGCIYDDTRGKIVLYYVGTVGVKDLVAALKSRLPRYMLPNRTIQLERMCFTANGKVDRVALKSKYQEGDVN